VEFFNKPYDLLESKKFLLAFAMGMSIFVFFFLWVFEPFGLENLLAEEKFSVIGIYAGASLALSALQFFVLQPLVFRNYKVWNTFLWLLLHLVLIGFINGFINSFLWNDGYISLYYLLYFQWVVVSIGILPIALFVTIHYAWLMRRRAERAVLVSTQLSARYNNPAVSSDSSEPTVVLKAANGKQALSCNPQQLIMVASVENYVEIHWLANDVIQKDLIRNTLINIEYQLSKKKLFFRCHKSYIVNKHFVRKVSGNAAGYKLHLSAGNYEVPVSRSLNTKIKSIF